MFGIASIIAALVGAAATAYGQQQSARAVNSATNDAMINQNRYASEIQKMAQDRAQDYETETRKKQQDAITEELADDYTAQPISAAQIASDAAATQGDTSSDYAQAKADSDARVADNIKTFGNLLAKVHGAKILRQRENWANADAANQAGVQQALMQSQNRLDNYKIQNAANKGSGWQTFGSLASLAGTALGAYNMANGLADLGSAAGTAAMEKAGADSLADYTGNNPALKAIFGGANSYPGGNVLGSSGRKLL